MSLRTPHPAPGGLRVLKRLRRADLPRYMAWSKRPAFDRALKGVPPEV